MKKRLLALLLAGAVFVRLAIYSNSEDEGSANIPANGGTTPVTDGTDEPSAKGRTAKMDVICIGNENDRGYTYSFMKAMEEATTQLAEWGIIVEWSCKKGVLKNFGYEGTDVELAEDGCGTIINNLYGSEPFMLKMAPGYPKIEFIPCTNQASAVNDLDNTHNIFASIYGDCYLASVAGDMRLQWIIDGGTVITEETVIDYVAAFPFAEVVLDYAALCQDAESVCPSVTMGIRCVSSQSDAPQEAAVASALVDEGYMLTSQHFGNTTLTTSTQDAGVLYRGYNSDITGVAPEINLTSYHMDWTPYFVYTISVVANDEGFGQNWTAGYTDDSVKLTKLDTATAAPGTKGALGRTGANLAGGLHVSAGPLPDHPAQSPDDKVWSIGEGEFSPRSDLSQEDDLSVPQLCYVIDGVTGGWTKGQARSKGGTGSDGPTSGFSPTTTPGAFIARNGEYERGERFGSTGAGKGNRAWSRSV